MQVFQIAVYIVMLISLLLTTAMVIMNMICSRKRDKEYYKTMEELKQRAIDSFNKEKDKEC